MEHTERENDLALVNEAQKALEEFEALKQRQEVLEGDIRKTGKELTVAERTVTQAIADAVDQGREDILSGSDKEINAARNQLKKAQNRKERALKQGVNARIAEETASEKDEIRDYQAQIRALLRENSVPRFCRSYLYNALFRPACAAEFAGLAAALLILLGVLPLAIYEMLPWRGTFWIFIVYLVIVVIEGALYLKVFQMTRGKHREVLAQSDKLRKEIRRRKKQIRRTSRELQRNVDEEHYNLEEYDEEIRRQLDVLEQAQKRKEVSIQIFEEETKIALTEAARGQHQAEIRQLNDALAALEGNRDQLVLQAMEQRRVIKEKYESRLGGEFLTAERLVRLRGLLESGEAANLEEAKEKLSSETASALDEENGG